MARSWLVVKWTVFVILSLSGGFLIERLTRIQRWQEYDFLVADDLIYNTSSPMMSRNLDRIMSKNYQKCVTEPSKPFCLLSINKRLEVFRSKDEESPVVEEIENRLRNVTSDFRPRRQRMHQLLVAFTKFMKSGHVKVVLIEPSMLFCMLSSTAKLSMLSKAFNPGRLLGSRNVVSVGIMAEDSKKLNANNLTSEMLLEGFKIIRFRKWIGLETQRSFETVHYFFIAGDVAVHAVVFYSGSNYLWHAGLDPKGMDFEGLLFVNEEIYENFTLLPLNLVGTFISGMYLPHDIRHFMKEILSSKFIECTAKSSGIATDAEHPNLTTEQMSVRAVIALKELKTLFAPYGTFFWLWSRTLLGWFTECNIFHFSSTLDLGLKFENINELNVSEILEDNEFLKIRSNNESDSKFGYKLDCHGLVVNLHTLQEDNGLVWHTYGDDGDELTYKYPSFTLCSSEVFGQKILVPCNATDVLEVDYTQNRTSLIR